MPAKPQAAPVELENVRIPARFYLLLDDQLNALKVRILRDAARRAKDRGPVGTTPRVTQEDILHVAQLELPRAAAELTSALHRIERNHALPKRKKAS